MRHALAAVAAALMMQTAVAAATSDPVETVEAFGEALAAGDAAAVEQLMTADALIAEEGDAERSFEEYKFRHLPADIEFAKSVQRVVVDRRVFETRAMATVVTTAEFRGSFRGREVARRSMETMTLLRDRDAWMIAHIHWSSAPLPGPAAASQ